jgi:hypothetical protein
VVRFEIPYVKRQVRERRRRNGSLWHREYWYYRRPGAPDDGARLPGTPEDPAFHETLRRFNDRAISKPPEEIKGTFANLVRRYQASPEYTDLQPKTRREYAAHLKRVEAMIGAFPAAAIEREAVREIRDKLRAKPHMANAILRTLRLFFNWALDLKLVPENPAANPKQLKVRPRRVLWSLEAEEEFLAKASPEMRLAFLLHVYVAQRQSDNLSMTWTQYQNGRLRLRQAKTDAWIEVPAHRVLRAALEAVPRRSTHILTDAAGRPWKGDNFRHHWRAVTLAAGLDGLQNRDLRRTAMVRMAEAGATDIEIAAVSGHDIEETKKILETYIPRTGPMAARAVRKLERAGTRSKPKE